VPEHRRYGAAVSKKRRSRQTRRYSTTRPKPGPARPSKQPAWRRVGGRSGTRASWTWVAGLVAIVVVGAALLIASSGSSSSSAGSSTGPLLASTASFDDAGTQPVDGISCLGNEQLLFHIHSHLAVFVNGEQRTIPMGIGISPPRTVQQGFVVLGSCFYFLHAHTPDGIIHIESPVRRTYTLGNYFDIWHQPLSPTQVGPALGAVTAYRNGVLFTGNPRDITLGNHTLIQLDVGKAVPFKNYSFPAGY
jgi:hypothetical protein